MLNALGGFSRVGLSLVALLVALCGCAGTSPKVWSYDEKAEVERGSKQHTTAVNWSGKLDSTAWSDYVSAVGSKLAAASERPTLKWQFTVLDSASPDAFATRGGYVYITRGMLALLRSENDLAAVLAHEIAHISSHDSQRKETLGNAAALGTLAVAVAYAPAALLLPQLTFAPAGAGLAAFSRQDELEADRRGAEYLRRAGYPPESMAAVMPIVANIEAFQREQQKARGRSPGWTHRVFASHPDPGKREARLGHTESAAQDPEFLARLDGLEVGSTKREGIPYGGKRYFSQWDVLLEVPEGWTAGGSSRRLWVSRNDRRGSMHLESVGTGTAEDLCEALASLAKDAPLTELQRGSEGGVQSCKGLARKSTRTLFHRTETAYRVGIVAPDATPGARYFYREFRSDSAVRDDPVFLSIARSIESLGEVDDRPRPPAVRIRKAREGDTFATLAKSARGIPNPEAVLRLLNQRYPSGEPEAGELVKVIE